MNILQLEETLKNAGIILSGRAISEIIGMAESSYSRKRRLGSEIKYQDIVKIEKALDINLTDLNNFLRTNGNIHMLDSSVVSNDSNIIQRNNESTCPYRMEHNCPCKEQFEIKYLECLPEEAKLPEITSVHKDAQIIKDHWHREAENLRIMPMQGDGLTTYWYPCQNRDILIIDINSTIPTREGLYAYSAKNNTMLFVAKLSQMMDGTIKIEKFEATGEVSQKIVSPEKQKEVDFRVIGRVVNNESLSL